MGARACMCFCFLSLASLGRVGVLSRQALEDIDDARDDVVRDGPGLLSCAFTNVSRARTAPPERLHAPRARQASHVPTQAAVSLRGPRCRLVWVLGVAPGRYSTCPRADAVGPNLPTLAADP